MYFTDPVLFELPVLPGVQKFIRAKLTSEAGQTQPMLVDPTALGPGLMLWAMCQSEKIHLFTKYGDQGYRHRQDGLTGCIGVGIGEFHYTRHQYLLNLPEQWVFSKFVTYMIKNELVDFCDAAPGVPIMSRIKAFCDQYDFSDLEFSEESLRQVYLRHRKKIGANGFSPLVTRNLAFVPMQLAA